MTTLLITDAALLHVETGTVHPGSSARVEGERIVDVARGRALDASPDDQVVEAGAPSIEHATCSTSTPPR